ncbi:uncharacterized protein [Patagioenas fasciata]|uniref:uncharacterized protein n=1 Tax=Patagioenas fasciata TaxID=372321 RepID=UPI003A99EC2A
MGARPPPALAAAAAAAASAAAGSGAGCPRGGRQRRGEGGGRCLQEQPRSAAQPQRHLGFKPSAAGGGGGRRGGGRDGEAKQARQAAVLLSLVHARRAASLLPTALPLPHPLFSSSSSSRQGSDSPSSGSTSPGESPAGGRGRATQRQGYGRCQLFQFSFHECFFQFFMFCLETSECLQVLICLCQQESLHLYGWKMNLSKEKDCR